MNPSPSSESVGSQKPSTAASTASGKKRTIIVARNLPDPSATGAGTSSSSSRSRPVAPSPSTPGLPRDSLTGKLTSYAALGGEEDVELYERFLAEKRSAIEKGTGGGASSPQHLKASAKRRTLGQLPVNGEGMGFDPPGTEKELAATSDESVFEEKQRRDAMVQHRKWLKSLPIHERLAYERQQNVLKKWKKINRQWEEFKAKTSKKLGKSEKQLVMSRSSEYREQIEMYDALQRALPLSEKMGADIWLVSLRNECTRYVPVGNIFSGLYCPIRESSAIQPRVRRPLDYTPSPESEEQEDKHMSTLAKRSLDALAQRKRRHKKQLEVLFPHEVEPSHSGQLRVETMDLFDWASSSRDERGDGDDGQLSQHSSSRTMLLPLNEVDQEDVSDGINSQRSVPGNTPRRRGPNLRVFTTTHDSFKVADEDQAQPIEIDFFADVNTLQQVSLWLENFGTTVLQFQWRRVDIENNELVPHLTQHHQAPLDEPERVTWTMISQQEGVFLPGECLEMVFSFQSKRAGVWLENWCLDINPPVPGPVGRPTSVQLHCTAVDNFVASTKRMAHQKMATQSETVFLAEQILKHDVIARVDPVYPVVFADLDETTARAFYDAHRRGEFENVQYSVALMKQCQQLFEQARAVASPPRADAESGSDDSQPQHSPAESDEGDVAVPAPQDPVPWDGQLSSLKEVAIAVDARLATDLAALKATLQATRTSEEGDDDEEDEEDLMEKVLQTKTRKKEAELAAVRALEPHFLDDFQSICCAASVSPYCPSMLNNTLAEKLAAMGSEAPVVLEIAQMLNGGNTDVAREAAYEMLRPLLLRAIDESIQVDADHEVVFEDAKRQFHNVALARKKNYRRLPMLVREGQPLTVVVQIDLDIANWFTVTTMSTEDQTLEWKLSSKLLEHATHVPPKVATAAASIASLMEILAGTPAVLVLVSELSTPPMTKAMKKMVLAQASIQAMAAVDGSTPDAASVEATLVRLQQKRDAQLTLKGVDRVLQRALGDGAPSVAFVGSLAELEQRCDAHRPQTPQDGETETTGTGNAESPRLFLMEHLGALARHALVKSEQKEAIPSTTSASAPSADKGKPAAPAPADKKKVSVVAPKVSTPRAPDAKDEEPTVEIPPGMSMEMHAAQQLGQHLAKLSDVLVVDAYPMSWWESTLVYFASLPLRTPTTVSAEENDSKAAVELAVPEPKHVLVGPRLSAKFALWGSLFQHPQNAHGRLIAIVGGRGLERKLRLLDGLIEHAESIYVVGELAMTVYRALHTKQLIKTLRQERKPIPAGLELRKLIRAVERLMEKGYRKQVALLLPFDVVVGDSRLDLSSDAAQLDEEEEEEQDEEEEEEEEEDEDDDDTSSRKKKKQMTVKPVKVQKPLNEPAEIDTWEIRRSFDGERATVALNASAWVRFHEVSIDTLSRFAVVDGNPTLLESQDNEDSEGAVTSPLSSIEWTSRVFDIGPRSVAAFVDHVRETYDQGSASVFLNGTLGVLEYVEFASATETVVNMLKSFSCGRDGFLFAGKTTSRWLQKLDAKGSPPFVSSHQVKDAAALSYVVEAKPHAMLTAFDSE